MIRRLTASVALAAAATVGTSAGAFAYEPVEPTPGAGLQLQVGGQVTFTSEGFAPGSNVTFRLVDANGSAIATLNLTADNNGQFNYSFNINLSGAFALVANGVNAAGTPVQAAKPVSVGGSGSTAGGSVSGGSSSEGSTSGGSTSGGSASTDSTVAAPAEVISGSPKPVASGKVVNAGTARAANTVKGGQLAKTGPADLSVQLWAGSGLLAAGGALVAVSAMRRRQGQAS